MGISAETIRGWIDPQEVTRLASRLVTLRSENPPGNETGVARWLGRFLLSAGLKVAYQSIEARRSNLVARLYGNGSGPTLLLCGHMDTMPVSSGWSVDPLGGQIIDGKLFGRGSADMKGGLAAMAVACAVLGRAKIPIKGSLILAAVIDEENRGAGAQRLVESGLQADWAVIGEPTGNLPVIVSNGQINFEFTLHGQAGHGSTPSSGRNAILDGIRLVNAIQKYTDQQLPARSHPLVGPASINIGTFHGGIQTSIIPDTCEITIDRRVAPDETTAQAILEMESVLAAVKKEFPGLDANLRIPYCLPPVQISEDAPVVQALRQAGEAFTGSRPDLAGMRATTDAATLAGKGGIPTVIFGPGRIAQAHKPDEFIDIKEMVDAACIYTYTAIRLLT
jgi:succinyl-diaminopimelate desuccinylase